MLKVEPQEAVGIAGFYEIPGYNKYVVSKKGIVYNRNSGEFLEGSVNPAGYHNFRITDNTGLTLTWGLHRLLGYVFKHPGCSIERLVVNHLDGNKSNNDLDNLEWTTYQGNSEHAGENGLGEKCVPISVRNVDTGEVKHYPSFISYAREFGISKDAVSYRVSGGEHRVFPERCQFRVKDLSKPWYIPENIERSLLENTTWKMVLVKFLKENRVMEFNRVTDAAIYLKVAVPTISTWLDNPGQLVYPGLIQVKFAVDTTPWREVKDPIAEISLRGNTKAIYTVHAKTGEKTLFMSAAECAEKMGLKTTTLNYRLKFQDKVYSDGYSYNYYVNSSNE